MTFGQWFSAGETRYERGYKLQVFIQRQQFEVLHHVTMTGFLASMETSIFDLKSSFLLFFFFHKIINLRGNRTKIIFFHKMF